MATTRTVPCPMCGARRVLVDGAVLRGIRLHAGLTLTELCRRMGYSMSYLWDVEHNRRNCSADLLRRAKRAVQGKGREARERSRT